MDENLFMCCSSSSTPWLLVWKLHLEKNPMPFHDSMRTHQISKYIIVTDHLIRSDSLLPFLGFSTVFHPLFIEFNTCHLWELFHIRSYSLTFSTFFFFHFFSLSFVESILMRIGLDLTFKYTC